MMPPQMSPSKTAATAPKVAPKAPAAAPKVAPAQAAANASAAGAAKALQQRQATATQLSPAPAAPAAASGPSLGTKALDAAKATGAAVAGGVGAVGTKLKNAISPTFAPTTAGEAGAKVTDVVNKLKMHHIVGGATALGAAGGFLAPGTDENGHRKSRLEGMMSGGMTGLGVGVMGAPIFAGARRFHNSTVRPNLPGYGTTAPAAAPAAPAPAAPVPPNLAAPLKGKMQPVAAPGVAGASPIRIRTPGQDMPRRPLKTQDQVHAENMALAQGKKQGPLGQDDIDALLGQLSH